MFFDYFLLNSHFLRSDAITDENRTRALAVLRDFSNQIPRATASRRLSLVIAVGDLSNNFHQTGPA